MILALLACGDPGPLLLHDGWVGVGSDPWGGGPPCDDFYLHEDEVVEVSTDTCPWVSLEQPLQRRVRSGTLYGGVVWDLLYADNPARAVLGVAIDGEVVFEETVPIPTGAGDVPIELQVPRLEAGTPVLIHVHNHGLNRYEWYPFRDVVE